MKHLQRKITLGFGSALFVLFMITVVAWWNAARFRSTYYWIEHTREVLSLLEQTLSEVLSMQGSARGFVLTGSDEVLQPFEVSSIGLERSLERLRQLVADNPSQYARVRQLAPLSLGARDLMLERVSARRARGLNAASETEAYLSNQQVVESVRSLVREMIAEERNLLTERLDRATVIGRWTVFALCGASVLAAVFVIVAVRLLRRDLHRRLKADEALQESFARIEDLYNNAPCGYHSLDETGTIAAMNDTALNWLGYTREEVLGRKKFTDVLAPGSREPFVERFAVFKREGFVTDVEYDWQRKDGAIFPVLLNASAIYDDAGRYVASRATVFDLTERKRAENERDRFFVLSRDLLCIAGTDASLKRINPAWEQTLGFSREELLHRPLIELVHPDDLERTKAEALRLSAGGEIVAFENRLVCKDGSFRWLRWNARPAMEEKLIYGSGHDVTEQRSAAEHIQWLNADLATRATQLEIANRELESFSYSVSHDLRAPLRHIDGFAGLLAKHAEGVLDAESRRFISVISRSAKQMGALIDDLLAFSRIGRMPLHLGLVKQDQLVAEVIANGRFDSDTRRIEWDLAPLPTVRGDSSMLRQVWANLIENAVKYSGKVAAPRIEIGCRTQEDTNEHIFFVRDNGVGFEMAYADKLFGVFQRLHSPSEFEGTGIGLANVRRIVSRHGGRTWAEGEPGKGACFYFSLPLAVSSSGVLR